MNSLFGLAESTGIFRLPGRLFPGLLTVLNYHRINDINQPGFDTFKANVSATPELFSKQMDYLRKNFNVITCAHLAAWLQGEQSLPPRSAIITFDDGYFDNWSNAYPVLKTYKLPATIFLTANFIGSNKSFYWDFVAYNFYHTQKDHARLPLLGDISWVDETSRHKVMHQWIETVKKLPEEKKQQLIEEIPAILNVSIPDNALAGLFLSWDRVREMSQNGIEFGSHTLNHPILTRIPLDQAKRELAESKSIIEAEVQKPVISLAYPNGQSSDISDDVVRVVKETGFQLAFTLLPGPTRLSSVKKYPLTIRRIFLSRNDTFPRFTAKLAGASRFIDW